MKKFISILLFFSYSLALVSQVNTIGLLYHELDKVEDGYTLFNPENQSTVFLIDNCGQVVHKWEIDDVRIPGKEQYLDESGRLYLASAQPAFQNPSFGTGGAGGIVEIIEWNGIVEYRRVLADSLVRQHHDIHIMPNGNIVAILWQNVSLSDAASAGFDTLSNPQIGFWPDKIIEIDPVIDSIVWEWNSMDHMIQDIDNSLPSFGDISENPQLIDINYIDFAFGRQDVHHINSIDYNPELNQILLSVRNFNEVWVIDHSTTTQEAASHSGGQSGKGGDLLFRWGNPSAYNSGDASNQQLFRQHDASWIIDSSNPNNGGVLLYNNFIAPELSLGQIFIPAYNLDSESYMIDNDGRFLPQDFKSEISHPDVSKNFSTAASNIQLLPNGNYMMCAGRQGRIFEITHDGELVWEYLVPLRNGFPISQGDIISLSENFTFSGRKYSANFSGFAGKDLSPKGYIELEPNTSFCEIVTVDEEELRLLSIFPNPVHSLLYLNELIYSRISITNSTGQEVISIDSYGGSPSIDVSSLKTGLYLLHVFGKSPIKFVKF